MVVEIAKAATIVFIVVLERKCVKERSRPS